MGIVTKLIGIEPPKIIQVPGVPERFCEVAIVQDFGETIRIVLARETDGRGPEMESTGLLVMPRGGFMRSLGWAATQFLWTKH